MTAKLKWHGDKFKNFVRKQVAAGMDATGTELHRICRRAASVPNTGMSVAVKRKSAGGNTSSRTQYPNPSKPGESPRMRTGFGQSNIVLNFLKDTLGWAMARVGYTRSARYMTFHELGIRYRRVGKQQRPTVVPSLRNNLARLRAIFQRAAGSVRP